MKQNGWLLFFFLFLSNMLAAQSPYQLHWKKELAFVSTGLGILGGGIYQRSQTPLYSMEDLGTLEPGAINRFDRNTVDKFSLSAHHASDFFWYGSASAPFLFLTNKNTRQEFGKIAALWGEVLVINGGLTLLTKYTVRRTRPFVYNEVAPLGKKLSPNAKGSFFSGHTSMTAANTFFAAKVFADYFPDSRWKPLVWGTAAAIPAVTGYLRVEGGRHFPTDVMVGYIVGAAVGILVPHWHRKKKSTNQKLSFFGGMNGALIRYQF